MKKFNKLLSQKELAKLTKKRKEREKELYKTLFKNKSENDLTDSDWHKVRVNDILDDFLKKSSFNKEHSGGFETKGAYSLKSVLGEFFIPTLDLDINWYKPYDWDTMKKNITDIINTKIDENNFINYEITDMIYSREDNSNYSCYQIFLDVEYYDMFLENIKIDSSCGDVTIKKENDIFVKTLTGGQTLNIKTCPIEISLAEKINSMFINDKKEINILRLKDYYSFYFVWTNYFDDIDEDLFFTAINKVLKQRGSLINFEICLKIIEQMKDEDNKHFGEKSYNFFRNRHFQNYVEVDKIYNFFKDFINYLKKNKDKIKDVIDVNSLILLNKKTNNNPSGGIGGMSM